MSQDLVRLDIQGMTCAACVSSVEMIVNTHEAVKAVSVNLPLNSAAIQMHNTVTKATIDEIIQKIVQGGFGASKPKQNKDKRKILEQHVSLEGRKAALALILALPTIYLTMFADDLGGFSGFDLRLLLAAVMTIPVYFWSGFSFHTSAWKSIRRGGANMDVLIHLGTSVAFIWSCGVVLAGKYDSLPSVLVNAEHVFFDGVVFIIGFVLLGNYLESAARLKATDAIHSLMQLQPNQARVVADDEFTEMVDVALVKVGTVVKVKTGETIPIDGILEDCKASIDQSTMTGESYPVRKSSGDEVYAGTIVLDGTVLLRTNKVAQDTLLANIISMVEGAQSGKAPIQRLVDKISAIFVPIVIILALLSGLFWATIGNDMIDNPMNSGYELALMVIISTLVIACPCALGLATPIALVIGTSVGAQNGLLIKGINALESVNQCQVMVVDKTGTVTIGRPRVSHIEIIDCEVKEILSIAAALEQESVHPLASAIITSWSNVTNESPEINDIRVMSGMGMVGEFSGQVVAAGNLELMLEVGIELDAAMKERITKATNKGISIVFVCQGAKLLGWIELSDRIRDSSKIAVKRAKQLGLEVVMLTGDNQQSAESIANQVGIDKVIFGVKPDEKAEQIKSLQSSGSKVIMIGDGINDAAALSTADVGIAMGAGSDIALDAADFVLIRNDLIDAVSSIELGNATMRRIRSNLGWAFSYNVIGIPLAMGLLLPFTGFLLPPAYAAAAMSLSSVSVVGNSLILRWWRPIAE
ncbi:MAG: copper-translocating P-type ATPase [Euryarchaeota archaeon]|jgi:P-type Cu+ transporter|nr:copper-translocating P-type ATPase [Euryarchaeota archaeon]MBT7988206.1 copper-translocating P-type ATPase [Euryarchaeota archaeon]